MAHSQHVLLCVASENDVEVMWTQKGRFSEYIFLADDTHTELGRNISALEYDLPPEEGSTDAR